MKSFLISVIFAFALLSSEAQLSAPDIVYTKLGPLTVQPVQHASLILTVHGLTIYVDPSGTDNYKGQKFYTFLSFEYKNRSGNYSAAVSSFCSSC